MKKVATPLLLSFSALLLGSCSMMGMMGGTHYTLTHQGSAPASVTGSVNVKSGDNVMTQAKVSGLSANTYYVAHYHMQGTASADPCSSGGMPIMSSKMVGMSDASGMVTLSGSVPKSEVMAATYYNVHTAKDASGTPADAGVACSAVTIK